MDIDETYPLGISHRAGKSTRSSKIFPANSTSISSISSRAFQLAICYVGVPEGKHECSTKKALLRAASSTADWPIGWIPVPRWVFVGSQCEVGQQSLVKHNHIYIHLRRVCEFPVKQRGTNVSIVDSNSCGSPHLGVNGFNGSRDCCVGPSPLVLQNLTTKHGWGRPCIPSM